MNSSNLDSLIISSLEEEQVEIANPWHSRPIDVHKWSEHPEIVKVVDDIWQAHFSELDSKGRSGPKPKTSFQHQLRIVI